MDVKSTFKRKLMTLPLKKKLRVDWWEIFNTKKYRYMENRFDEGRHISASYDATIKYFKNV